MFACICVFAVIFKRRVMEARTSLRESVKSEALEVKLTTVKSEKAELLNEVDTLCEAGKTQIIGDKQGVGLPALSWLRPLQMPFGSMRNLTRNLMLQCSFAI